MANKAIVKSYGGISDGSGSGFDLAVNASVTDGGSGSDITCVAHSSTFSPLLGWRPLIRQAVIDAAAAQLSVTVDAVLLPDGTLI